MSYKKERELLKNAIEEKKQEEINRLEEIQKKIDECTNPVDLLMMFVEIYGNTSDQAEYMISFIKSFAKEDFFKLAKTNRYANYVSFSYNDLRIMFPTSRCREIIVANDSNMKEPKEVKPLNDEYMRMVNNCKTYIENPTKQNLRNFTIDYLRIHYLYPFKPYERYSFFKKRYINKTAKNLQKNGITNILEKFNNEINKKNKEIENYKKALNDFNKEIKRIEDLFDTLETIKLFNEKNWYFEFKGIAVPTWINNTTQKRYF